MEKLKLKPNEPVKLTELLKKKEEFNNTQPFKLHIDKIEGPANIVYRVDRHNLSKILREGMHEFKSCDYSFKSLAGCDVEFRIEQLGKFLN